MQPLPCPTHSPLPQAPKFSSCCVSHTVKVNYFAPFLNIMMFLLMCWFYSSSNMKSLVKLDHLINEVILVKEFECLDNYHGNPDDIRSSFSTSDDWQETSVKIHVPADGVMHESLEDTPEFSVPGLFYRRPLEVIKNAFREASAEHFHFTPFEQHYLPSKMSAFAAHHIAYIPKLSDTIQDFYCDTFSKAATSQVLTHCHHELMQAIWLLLMDDDFMHAYEFGIILECLDGIRRHIFPHFFTYSADYPEKMLLACIKFLAQCPCPRCLTLKSKIRDLGKKVDRRSHWLWLTITIIRDLLYRKGVNITSKRVKDNLGPRSLIPTLTRLKCFGVNFYELCVPDLLHEFELGVWKAVFTHLLCILYAHGEEAIQNLNRSNNASGMKCLAGRDFEDLLQVRLLFSIFQQLSICGCTPTRLSQFLRSFLKATAKEYVMKDLPSKEAARGHCKANKAAKGTGSSTDQGPRRSGQQMSGPKVRHFNFQTYKLHALIKRFYPCVSKAKFTAGIAKQQCHKRLLCKMAEGSPYEMKGKGKQDAGKEKSKVLWLSSPDAPALHFEDSEPLHYSDPEHHYHISTSTRYHVNIYKWLAQHESDPALNKSTNNSHKNFLPQLKDHLLSRLCGLEYDGDEREFTSAEHSTITLVREKIFRHKVLWVNYTTYDLHCNQDSLNPRTNADIMLLAHEDGGDGHPYWYARILGIFHALVIHTGEHSKSHEPQQMDFLWVRWFSRDPVKRLEWVGFIPSDDPGAFGFLDPQQVIRGIHLVPAFHYGHTDTLLPPSIAHMMMRFRGGGVGHKSTRQATDWFLSDRDKLDEGGETNAEEEFNDEMDDMEIEDAEFDSDERELRGNAEMEDTETEGAEQPGLDSDEEADEDEIEEYGYDGIKELEESDKNKDEDGGGGGMMEVPPVR
ncbi:hypothetical protein DFJ58DRAFT_718370 [Suillus subalutaceus]|uniref:uncharacterized protein n=1 Tax=Suillus subalutaceus TaxID=48586 RepID=UPI001B882676|nr:uncharacterized protein DFJ58DRAFT_718370 [Suillus subalutaceus]KAG1840499.1 hypothetical protein DFJ58DRAFT_718370 [Suillus subalutaceus]